MVSGFVLHPWFPSEFPLQHGHRSCMSVSFFSFKGGREPKKTILGSTTDRTSQYPFYPRNFVSENVKESAE